MQAFISTMGQARVHGPGLVGAVEHFIKTLVHHQGQALTTIGGIATQGRPTARHKLCIGLLEAIGCFDLMGALIQLATLLVANRVQGQQHFSGKFATLFQHGGNRVGVHVGMGWQGFQGVGHMQDLVHDELHVAQGWGVNGHGDVPIGEMRHCARATARTLARCVEDFWWISKNGLRNARPKSSHEFQSTFGRHRFLWPNAARRGTGPRLGEPRPTRF